LVACHQDADRGRDDSVGLERGLELVDLAGVAQRDRGMHSEHLGDSFGAGSMSRWLVE
jgi:hypothetical protein